VAGRVSRDMQDLQRTATQVNLVVVVQDARRRCGEDAICGWIKGCGQDGTGSRRLQRRAQMV
jgi:hypothetical protein